MRRVPAVFLLALLALITLAGPAMAHTELAELSPAPGSAAKEAPGAVALTFTQEVDERLATVTVLDDAGATVVTGQPRRSGLVLLQPVSDLAPGRYVVQWRAAAADGHILRGDYRFRVGATTAGGSDADSESLTPAEQLLAAHEGPNHKDKPSYAISAADRRKAAKAAAGDGAGERTAAPAPAAPTPDNGSATVVTLLGAALAVTTATAVVESVRAHRV